MPDADPTGGRGFDSKDTLRQALDGPGWAGMSAAEADGLLTALALAPSAPERARWEAVIVGHPSPAHTAAETRAIHAAKARWHALVSALSHQPPRLDPVLEVESVATGRPSLDAWAEGFLEGLALAPRAWRPLLTDPKAALLLAPILRHCRDPAFATGDHGAPVQPLLPEDPAASAEADLRLLPDCLAGIRAFWQTRAATAPRAPTAPTSRSRRTKPGRNDPCPCGSGRKVKHCCGPA